MRYIAIHKHHNTQFYPSKGGLNKPIDIYVIEQDTGHGYLMNVKTNEISFREAKLKPSGIYYEDGTYIIPETDSWFNYFLLEEKILNSKFGKVVDITKPIYYQSYNAFAAHMQKLIK